MLSMLMMMRWSAMGANEVTAGTEPILSPVGAESWKGINGFPGYEVSELGRVRSLYFTNRMIRKLRAVPLIMKPRLSRGYPRLDLCRDGTVYPRSVHRLVLEAFVGPCPKNHEAAHDDGNRARPALANLAWKTHTENESDKLRHGRTVRGTRHPNCKLSGAEVSAIRSAYRRGVRGSGCRRLADQYGVSLRLIWNIVNGKVWPDVNA